VSPLGLGAALGLMAATVVAAGGASVAQGTVDAGPDAEVATDGGASFGETVEPQVVRGGRHWRLGTAQGVVHVWRPNGFVPRTAGTVLYVHGYYTDVDGAWRDHSLAQQFSASRANALFIAPEAPNGGGQDVQFKDLAELLSTVSRLTKQPLPQGPVIAVGHSGAYRTLSQWVSYESLREIYLLDALYANEVEFDAWLDRPPLAEAKRLVMVGYETNVHSEAFCGGERRECSARRDDIPRRFSEFTRQQKRAKILYLQSQYDHMQIVTGGQVIPLLLRLTPLRRL
jgi:hypothetical protein